MNTLKQTIIRIMGLVAGIHIVGLAADILIFG